jgi:hypothetical protein
VNASVQLSPTGAAQVQEAPAAQQPRSSSSLGLQAADDISLVRPVSLAQAPTRISATQAVLSMSEA